jgi:hypothetical protein
MPEVAIGTAGIEGASFGFEEGLQHMLENVLRHNLVMHPLSISSVEGSIAYPDGKGNIGDQQNAVHYMVHWCGG